MTIDRKNRFTKPLIGLLLLISCSAILVVLILRSDWIPTKIEKEFQQVTGYEMALKDSVSLKSIYPRLTFSIPSLVIRAPDQTGAFSRLRLTDVESSLPFEDVKGQFHRNLIVKANSLAAIVNGGSAPEQPSSTEKEPEEGIEIEDMVGRLLNEFSGTNVSLQVQQINLIYREDGQRASTYQSLSNNIALTSEQFGFSGDYVDRDQTTHPFESSVDISRDTEGVSGKMSVSIYGAKEEKPYSLTGQYQINRNNISLDQLNFSGPELKVSGQINIDQNDKLEIEGFVNLQQAELARFQPVYHDGVGNSDYRERMFSDTPFDLFNDFNLDLALTFGAVRLNNQPIISGDVQILGDDRRFSLKTDKLLFLGGTGHLNMDGSDDGDERHISLKSYLNDAQLSRLQITKDEKLLFTKGKADMKVSLQSSGSSTASLARTLKGYFMLASSNVEVSQRYAEKIDRGIVSLVRRNIDNLRKNNKTSGTAKERKGSLPLSCASVKLVINDGYLEVVNGLIVELPDNILYSSGYIDLHSEKLGFAFRTRKKKLFDWSALSLIKFIELGGTLVRPGISLDRKALLKQGLLTTASVLVGSLPPLVYRLAETGINSNKSIDCIPSLTN